MFHNYLSSNISIWSVCTFCVLFIQQGEQIQGEQIAHSVTQIHRPDPFCVCQDDYLILSHLIWYFWNQLGDKSLEHKYFKEKEDDIDRISKLPDEVLVTIVSLLSITEAARSSVLSHRWEKLWTFYTGSLKFDFQESLKFCDEQEELWVHERSKYISQVNQVLASLDVGSSSALDEFTLLLLDFELDFAPLRFMDEFMCYTFPLDCYARIKQPCSLYRISALTSLSLKSINLPGGFVDFFLSSCPLLERLRVVCVKQLLNLKVTGAELKLKYLEINNCDSLEYVEIAAPNLLSLIYFGHRTKFHIKTAPRLSVVNIGPEVITLMSHSLSSYFSQLETLRLHFSLDFETHREFTQSIQLSRIKHLILCVGITGAESLLGWTSLIEASPFLQKFTLELLCLYNAKYCGTMRKLTATHPHKCLKVVEFVGFVGCETDTELAMYFFANASKLEKIIIDRCSDPRLPLRARRNKEAKKRGLKLKKYLPPEVEFVLI